MYPRIQWVIASPTAGHLFRLGFSVRFLFSILNVITVQLHVGDTIQELFMLTQNVKTMLQEHLDARSYHMQCDETYDFGWLLGESILASCTDLEKLFMERLIYLLVTCSEVDIDLAGVNDAGDTLYRRLD